MSGCMAIDHDVRDGLVSAILSIVQDEGFTLIAIRTIPCADGKRATLTLNLNVESRSEWRDLERKVGAIPGVQNILHCSDEQRSADS